MDKTIYKDALRTDSATTLIDVVNKSTEHKNELVLQGWTVCILLEGIVDDGDDYYWRLLEPNRGIIYSSCVGRIEFLKGKLDKKSYDYVYSLFKMNHHLWEYKKMRESEDRYEKEQSTLEENFNEIKEIFNE